VVFQVLKIIITDVEGVELVTMKGKLDSCIASFIDRFNCIKQVQIRQAECAVAEFDHEAFSHLPPAEIPISENELSIPFGLIIRHKKVGKSGLWLDDAYFFVFVLSLILLTPAWVQVNMLELGIDKGQ
jgi:hypothetical protein